MNSNTFTLSQPWPPGLVLLHSKALPWVTQNENRCGRDGQEYLAPFRCTHCNASYYLHSLLEDLEEIYCGRIKPDGKCLGFDLSPYSSTDPASPRGQWSNLCNVAFYQAQATLKALDQACTRNKLTLETHLLGYMETGKGGFFSPLGQCLVSSLTLRKSANRRQYLQLRIELRDPWCFLSLVVRLHTLHLPNEGTPTREGKAEKRHLRAKGCTRVPTAELLRANYKYTHALSSLLPAPPPRHSLDLTRLLSSPLPFCSFWFAAQLNSHIRPVFDPSLSHGLPRYGIAVASRPLERWRAAGLGCLFCRPSGERLPSRCCSCSSLRRVCAPRVTSLLRSHIPGAFKALRLEEGSWSLSCIAGGSSLVLRRLPLILGRNLRRWRRSKLTGFPPPSRGLVHLLLWRCIWSFPFFIGDSWRFHRP